jgi:hypothetical protein
MKSLSRWLLVLAMAVFVGAGAWLASALLEAGVHSRLTHKLQQRVASLPDQQAIRLVRHLALEDGQWLDVLVAASADDRPAVAAAAERALRELVDRWAELAPEESSPRAAELASLLAEQAPPLPTERRQLAHSLAERLIDWPVDAQRVDVAKLIADCHSVLLLPWGELIDIRLAAARGRESMAE